MIFSRKLNKSNHPKIYFNNAPVFCVNWQKHLGIYFDESLNFSYHIKEKMPKTMKGIVIIRNLNKALPQHSLITIQKSLVRPHLDYGDIIYNQPNKESLNQKLKEFNIMLLLQLQVASKELIRAGFTMN